MTGAAALATTWVAGSAAGDSPMTGPADPSPQTPPLARPTPPAQTPNGSPTPPHPATATPSPQRRPVYTLADYRRVVPGPAFPGHAVALTIDDGPHPVWTPKILKLLDRYHVPATFCLIGNQVRGHESVARSVVAAGHHLANHTWSHPTKLHKFAPGRIHTEIEKAQEKIHSATGYEPKLFRSPGGGWSSALSAQAAGFGMTCLDWSDDPRDWSRPGTPAIVHRLLAARPGQILLCHDGGGDRSQTYAALQQVIPALLARGYHFVAL